MRVCLPSPAFTLLHLPLLTLRYSPFTVSEALSFGLLALTIEVNHVVEFKENYGKAAVG